MVWRQGFTGIARIRGNAGVQGQTPVVDWSRDHRSGDCGHLGLLEVPLPPMSDGYWALRQTAAVLDLSGRGKIRLTGEDRARLLHAMTTNHVEQLTPGTGCYAFFLNAQGRILADVNILCLADALLLDIEPEIRRKVFEHLDHYIIA